MTNIPKKLNIDLEDGDSVEGAIYTLEAKINELIDYLQAKEDKSYKAASSACCDSSFRLEGDTKEGTMFHVCNNCNKACDIKLTEKKVEASKGECICEDKNNPHTHLVVCPVHGILNHYSNSNPPEHEERQAEDLLTMFGSKMRECGRWEESLDYLRADVAFSEAQEIKVKIQSLGLGD